MEIHTIELHKKLLNKPIDEWIQIFNAKTEEELDMIESDNPGIKEAIQTIKEYGLKRVARAHYESWLKAKRDQYAMDKYIQITAREEGLAEGLAKGIAEDIIVLLAELGEVSQGLQNEIMTQKDIEVLRKWLKMAAKSVSIEEFESGMKMNL